MGTSFRKGMFGEDVEEALEGWAGGARAKRDPSENHRAHMDKPATESSHSAAQEMVIIGGTELSSVTQAPVS
jgi:mlo protein